MNWHIIRLNDPDQAAYNAFFRSGVVGNPLVFRIRPEDIDLRPFATGSTADRFTLAAVDDHGQYLGVVSFEREVGRETRRHVGWIYRMFVSPDAAGRGIGRELILALIDQARAIAGVEQLNLTVITQNLRAIRLYESVGFIRYSTEPRAIRHGDVYLDEDQMQLRL